MNLSNMPPNQTQRFSFTKTAAQQPTRQRFSFAQNKPTQPTLSQSMDAVFPQREMLRNIATAPRVPAPKQTSAQAMEKVASDKARGVTISQAEPEKISPIRQIVRAIPGDSRFEQSLERNVLDPIARVGRAIMPTISDRMRQIVDEKPGISNEELQKELQRRVSKEGIALTGRDGVITPDTPVFSPDIVGMIRRVPAKLAERFIGAKTADDAVRVAREAGVTNPTPQFIEDIVKANDEQSAQRLVERISAPATPSTAPTQTTPTQPVAKAEIQTAPTEPATRERGFVTSVKEQVPEANKVAGQYVVRNTDELAIKARNEVEANPVFAEDYIRSNTDEKAVAMASEYIKKLSDDATKATDEASKAALYDKAAEIANDLAPRLTEIGRTIQAASILGRLTPAGQIRFAAKEIQRYNRANPARRIPELTGEQARYIGDEMTEIEKMPEGLERSMRFKELQDYVQDLVPTPLWKKVSTVWKAGLLTGLKTSGLNILSNLSHFVSETAKDAPAALVDRAASLFTGERTKVFTMQSAFDGMKEGAIKGKRYFFTGFDERNIGEKLDYTRVNFGKGNVAKAFKAYTETVFRVIGAQDQPFYYATLSRSLMDQALAKGMNEGLKGKALVARAYEIVENPTEDMIRYATSDASTAVFMNRTKLGEAASTVQKIPYVGEFFIPFARTPSAVAMQIISYSPAGFVKAAVESVANGKFDQRVFSHGTGRAIIGTAVMAIGYKLAEQGLVSGSFPTGDEREQELQRAEGTRPNSVKVGDKWRSPLVLGPLGNLMLVGAEFQRSLKEHGSPTEAISAAVLGSAKAFTEQTFLTGLSDAVNAITDPERYAGQYLPNLVASFVPTLVSDIARATDDVERRPDTTIDRIAARIPGARQTVEPQVDILGRQQARVGNPLEVMLDPTRPSPEVGTVVTEELRRLAISGFEVSPTKLGDRQGYDVLEPEQNTKLWEMSGKIVNQKLSSLFANEKYIAAPDDKKAKAVEDIVTKAKDYSRAALVVELTEGMEGQELKTKLAELKEGGVLTRDVFRIYGEIR